LKSENPSDPNPKPADCGVQVHHAEQHKAIWAENIDSDFVGPDGIVLDDKEIFDGIDLDRALELFLERVTNEDHDAYLEKRDEALRELRELLADSDVEDEGVC
jgi:hypothetical protein